MMVMLTLLIRSSFTVDTDTLSSMWTPQKAVNHVSHLSSSMLLVFFFCHLLYTVCLNFVSNYELSEASVITRVGNIISHSEGRLQSNVV